MVNHNRGSKKKLCGNLLLDKPSKNNASKKHDNLLDWIALCLVAMVGKQIPLPGVSYFLKSYCSARSQKVYCPPELVDKALVLEITHILGIKYREIKQAPSWNFFSADHVHWQRSNATIGLTYLRTLWTIVETFQVRHAHWRNSGSSALGATKCSLMDVESDSKRKIMLGL